MKKFIITMLAVLVYIVNLNAQDISKEEWKKMSRKERKEYRMKIAEQENAYTMQLLNSKQWVLEAHQLQDRYGQVYNILSSLNFVGVDQEFGAIQLGSNDGIGLNGVGGITLEGNVRKYELKEGKNGGASLRIEILGSSAGHMSMSLHISSSGSASALVTDNFGNRLTYRGTIVSLAESSVFKGFTTY